MAWLLYAIGAIAAVATSDLFRKLGSNLKDPFTSNLIFQIGSVSTAVLLWLAFSRKFENDSPSLSYALVGGVLISMFTTLTFKALEAGPGVSTVIPVIRVGGVVLVAILGVLLFGDKPTWNLALGIILATAGVYLIFS